jgi:phosphoglycolate phosphatase-like HAD superfamily hydrolase
MFFSALAAFVPTEELSRKWNSYQIRNDDDIVSEVLARFGKPENLKPQVIKHYLSGLASALGKSHITSTAIPGAENLLQQLKGKHRLGLATANFIEAARLHLEQAGLWPFVSGHAIGADGGGHKHQLLARLLETLPLPRNRIVYVGDNVVDVEAGLKNAVHLIGFSVNQPRRDQLRAAGARHIAASHHETAALIRQFLAS